MHTYLEAENAYTAARHAPHRGAPGHALQGAARAHQGNRHGRSAPQGGYWYYSRTEQGKGYPIYCRKKGSLRRPKRFILDQNELARDKKFHALGGFDVSPDGSRLLYLEDLTAFREYTLYVKDLSDRPR